MDDCELFGRLAPVQAAILSTPYFQRFPDSHSIVTLFELDSQTNSKVLNLAIRVPETWLESRHSGNMKGVMPNPQENPNLSATAASNITGESQPERMAKTLKPHWVFAIALGSAVGWGAFILPTDWLSTGGPWAR